MHKLLIFAIILIFGIIYIYKVESIYYEIDNFITKDECDMLIDMSKDNLQPSLVYSTNSDSINNNSRKSDQVWLKPNMNLLTKKITKLVAEISKKPVANQEEIQVVKYDTGGFFIPHYDACDGDAEYCKRMNGKSDARFMTCLIYLNDNFEGGETVFPKLNITIKPKKGKALIFYNTDIKQQLIINSIHGGEPIKSGQKWIANIWVRHNTFIG